MGKSKFGKHSGYMDQIMARLNKILLQNFLGSNHPGYTEITISKGLLEDIVSTWKRIKEEGKRSESCKDIPKGYQPVFSDLDPRKPPQGGSGVPPKGE